MLIEISNRYRKSEKAAEFLYRSSKRLPPFKITTLRAHNGIVVDVSDDDAEDLVEAVSAAGFACEPESPSLEN